MTRLPDQFVEDRALRDAARAVLLADIAHARASLSGKGIATRVGSRIADGAKDVVEVARVQAEDNRGVLAILIGAIIVWLTREPIMEILGAGLSAQDVDDPSEVNESDAEGSSPDDVAEPAILPGDDDE